MSGVECYYQANLSNLLSPLAERYLSSITFPDSSRLPTAGYTGGFNGHPLFIRDHYLFCFRQSHITASFPAAKP